MDTFQGYVAPHPNAIRRSLKRLQHFHYACLFKRLRDVESLSLTCDFWSNRNSKSFFVLTGHFISPQFKLEGTVLDVSHFSEEYSADKIANHFQLKLEKLNIFNRIAAITCDGASNLKKALLNIGDIKSYMVHWSSIAFDYC